MGKTYDRITPEIEAFLGKQKMFFVATAPLATEGLVNCSPKGGDSFRILGPRTIAYQDLTGSGIETVAHLRENGRIVIMFCAFEGAPKIVRLHGSGNAVEPGHPEFAALEALFPSHLGTRAIVRVHLSRISDSCGYAVPCYQFKEQRDQLDKWTAAKGSAGLVDYRKRKNLFSLEGLPGLPQE